MTNYYGAYTLFKRETKRFLRVWGQTIASPVFSNLLYFAIFGLSLRTAVAVDGMTYLQFIVPGLILMGMSNNAYLNPASSIMITKYQGLVNDLMSIPVRPIDIYAAYTLSAIIRAFLVGIATLVTSLFFVNVNFAHPFLIFLVAFLINLVFSNIGTIVGLWAPNFDRQSFIQTFVLTPLTMLGGVFFPISRLPDLYAKIAAFNPIVHMTDLLRYSFYGISEFPVLPSFITLSAVALTLSIIAYTLIRRGYNLQT